MKYIMPFKMHKIIFFTEKNVCLQKVIENAPAICTYQSVLKTANNVCNL